MLKTSRHFTIKEIIAEQRVSSQEELRRELRKRGFRVTQATLSRDLSELGVARVAAGQGARYVIPASADGEVLQRFVSSQVVSINANESLIVVHTLSGCANTVGEFIDLQKHPHIIGTVAGDNTLLVIPESHRKTKGVVQFIKDKCSTGAQ
jgi:transcriptional regulator of arginine metabolism